MSLRCLAAGAGQGSSLLDPDPESRAGAPAGCPHCPLPGHQLPQAPSTPSSPVLLGAERVQDPPAFTPSSVKQGTQPSLPPYRHPQIQAWAGGGGGSVFMEPLLCAQPVRVPVKGAGFTPRSQWPAGDRQTESRVSRAGSGARRAEGAAVERAPSTGGNVYPLSSISLADARRWGPGDAACFLSAPGGG